MRPELSAITQERLGRRTRHRHPSGVCRRPTLAPEAAQVLIRAARYGEKPQSGLTARELEILKLMADGLSNPEIAKRAFVSRSTVKFHVSNILMKLGASSRTEAVSTAIHDGLVK